MVGWGLRFDIIIIIIVFGYLKKEGERENEKLGAHFCSGKYFVENRRKRKEKVRSS